MEEQIRDLVSDFRTRLNEGRIDYEDYNNFLKQFGQYLEIEKPTFIDNLSFLIEYQLAICIGAISCGILQGVKMIFKENIITCMAIGKWNQIY